MRTNNLTLNTKTSCAVYKISIGKYKYKRVLIFKLYKRNDYIKFIRLLDKFKIKKIKYKIIL